MTVNHDVTGSSPVRGAKMKDQRFFIYEFEPDGSNVAGRFTAHRKGSLQRNTKFHIKRTAIGLHGQAVKTSPFHGGNTGSIPVGVIKNFFDMAILHTQS